ncbi:hypothetical protein E7V67_015250 [[Empedobacter] haloabium]|uniref:Uncharacterized protein n=1 Tax=[Empedobacter] haloabium TaxID=592317 RepID=A0ABZ1UED3_9BURK
MAFRPFGIGGWRRPGHEGINMWANLAASIGVLTYLVALLLYNGVFLGGRAACGGFGLTCLFEALVTLVAGGVAGTLAALASLLSSRKQRWLSWLALELNGLAILGVGIFLLWALHAH